MGVYKYESITVSDTAVGFTAANLHPMARKLHQHQTKQAVVTVETDQIRVLVDGDDPTSSEGHLVNPDDVLYIDTTEVESFKAIRVNTDATIRVSYEV